jgi:hypothetical protein
LQKSEAVRLSKKEDEEFLNVWLEERMFLVEIRKNQKRWMAFVLKGEGILNGVIGERCRNGIVIWEY